MNITIGNETFPSKSAAAKRCQSIIKNNPTINADLIGADKDFASALFDLHPEKEIKTGCGIQSFFVGRAPSGWDNCCLWARRADGTVTDFSYHACLTPPTPKADVLAAMRMAIGPQIIAYKQKIFDEVEWPVCAITGVPLEWNNSHVDHIVSFLSLAKEWLDGKDWKDILINTTQDQSAGTYFANKEDEESWQAFHAHFAQLRLTSAEANLRRKKISTD